MSRRGLTDWEADEARLVFSTSLDITRVVVHEGVTWPNWLAAINAKLHRTPPPSHNAVTLGNHIYFPVVLATDTSPDVDQATRQMAWLVHELTHCWQFQKVGIRSFFAALVAQIRLGSQAYAYGWEYGLEQALAKGETLSAFNPEQQGEITRHYYYRLKQGLDISAWRPWIQMMQAT